MSDGVRKVSIALVSGVVSGMLLAWALAWGWSRLQVSGEKAPGDESTPREVVSTLGALDYAEFLAEYRTAVRSGRAAEFIGIVSGFLWLHGPELPRFEYPLPGDLLAETVRLAGSDTSARVRKSAAFVLLWESVERLRSAGAETLLFQDVGLDQDERRLRLALRIRLCRERSEVGELVGILMDGPWSDDAARVEAARVLTWTCPAGLLSAAVDAGIDAATGRPDLLRSMLWGLCLRPALLLPLDAAVADRARRSLGDDWRHVAWRVVDLEADPVDVLVDFPVSDSFEVGTALGWDGEPPEDQLVRLYYEAAWPLLANGRGVALGEDVLDPDWLHASAPVPATGMPAWRRNCLMVHRMQRALAELDLWAAACRMARSASVSQIDLDAVREGARNTLGQEWYDALEPLDPWGRAYVVLDRSGGDYLVLHSCGMDGVLETRDDLSVLTRWR